MLRSAVGDPDQEIAPTRQERAERDVHLRPIAGAVVPRVQRLGQILLAHEGSDEAVVGRQQDGASGMVQPDGAVVEHPATVDPERVLDRRPVGRDLGERCVPPLRELDRDEVGEAPGCVEFVRIGREQSAATQRGSRTARLRRAAGWDARGRG